MNNQELKNLVCEISIEYFKIPFQHDAYFNSRLRTIGGRYMLKSHNIEINPKQYEKYGKKAIIDIIKHELCHYHLHLTGKGYKHRDSDFKVLSSKVGAPRFCTPTKSYKERANYIYSCKNCFTKYLRIRKVDVNKMRCGKCGGKLKLSDHISK
ncbi:SprT family protein [Staphylococcus pasteuri]|uniref:SprT family protein n=1 Tax=Staphylococcus pasteuri TaxID=45972 RepID=UPI000E6881B3|nr:SprT family protein [Staphylococcus pasteuri]RIO49551.1 SprT family protein [Staphylococcus pasteuri]